MKKMKKIILLLAVSIFSLTIISCGKSKAERMVDDYKDAVDDAYNTYKNYDYEKEYNKAMDKAMDEYNDMMKSYGY